MPRTGGHAVQVGSVGSSTTATLTVYYGTYQANMGNGILVSNGNVHIYDGTFVGVDSYDNNSDAEAELDRVMPGAAASYGFKMYGGTVDIYNGTFGDQGEKGSGAFVMGTTSRATANIYAGTFDVGGTAGFSVYQNATVYFGGDGDGEYQGTESLYLHGVSAALTVEGRNGGTASSITIYKGTFEGNQNGIWYGEAASTLDIRGGAFAVIEQTGVVKEARHGLHLNAGNTNYSNVHLSGGIFNSAEVTTARYGIYCDAEDEWWLGGTDYVNEWKDMLDDGYHAYGRNSATSGTYEQLSGEIRDNTRKYIVIATSTPTT